MNGRLRIFALVLLITFCTYELFQFKNEGATRNFSIQVQNGGQQIIIYNFFNWFRNDCIGCAKKLMIISFMQIFYLKKNSLRPFSKHPILSISKRKKKWCIPSYYWWPLSAASIRCMWYKQVQHSNFNVIHWIPFTAYSVGVQQEHLVGVAHCNGISFHFDIILYDFYPNDFLIIFDWLHVYIIKRNYK